MENNEFKMYEKEKNWNFSEFSLETVKLTNWRFYDILKENTFDDCKILDLGTGGGEKVLTRMPENCEILGTDYSPAMIETANKNLLKTTRKNVTFKVMDNLKMNVPDNFFDIITARNTITDKSQIFNCLKPGGLLLIHGIDKIDCWDLKKLFGFGQGYSDEKYMSLIDYNEVIEASFKNVELIPIYTREYFKDRENLEMFLRKVPILNEFNQDSPLDTDKGQELLDSYIKENTYPEGILLKRIYYGISARK